MTQEPKYSARTSNSSGSIRVAKSRYPGYQQAEQEHYITNLRVFDDQCVSIWFPAKSEGLGAGLLLQRPIVKMTP